MRAIVGLAVGAAAMAATWPGPQARGETCLSPFVKRLDRPEKYLYVFCVDADAKDDDFLAVIDVNPDSDTFGTITYTYPPAASFAVPEPSAWAMMALGFAGLGLLGYRKTRSDNALA